MLKGKIAMALAVAMVLATLYGCSSGVSDSVHNQVKDQVTDLTGTIDAIAVALGLTAGSSEADILAAVATATEDELAAIRTQLKLAADADSDAIVAAIMTLQTAPEPAPPVFVDLSELPEDTKIADGSAEIEAGGSATIGDVTYSCAAGTVGCTVMVENGAAVSTGAAVTVATSPAYATRKETAAITKSAETKEKEIADEAGQTTNFSRGGSTRTDLDGTTTGTDATDDPYGLDISRDRDGTKIEITDAAMAGDDDPKFMQMMDLGGGTTMHVRDNGKGVEEVVVVSTDIEAPEAVAFAMFENAAGTTTQTVTVRKDGETVDDDNPADSHDLAALAVADDSGTDTSNADTLALIMSSSFTANTAAALTFGGDDPADDEDAAFMTTGSYNGAMGTYTCAGGATDCTVSIGDKGKIIAISDGWIFTPVDGATSDQPDYDYLNYGFWLKRTTKDGVTTYNEVQTFAGSSIAASSDVSSVTGTAEYSGDATGVYVHAMVNPDGTRASATSGHFNADVNLTATFGQVTVDGTDTIADNVVNTVTGTIDKFDLSGGEANEWTVALSGDIAAGGVTGGMAKGGMGNGSLSATFHGPVTAVDGVVPKPHSVVGEFNAGFSNGSVAGAFGAREVKD